MNTFGSKVYLKRESDAMFILDGLICSYCNRRVVSGFESKGAFYHKFILHCVECKLKSASVQLYSLMIHLPRL